MSARRTVDRTNARISDQVRREVDQLRGRAMELTGRKVTAGSLVDLMVKRAAPELKTLVPEQIENTDGDGMPVSISIDAMREINKARGRLLLNGLNVRTSDLLTFAWRAARDRVRKELLLSASESQSDVAA